MKRFALLSVCALLLAGAAGAQTLVQDLTALAETPAVTGYEHALAAEIQARLKSLSPKTDNMGNVYVTLGTGAPHRLIVAPLDEPGYVVSGITEDGYLRVQRLPQAAPHGLFDLLHAAQPVLIGTRKGKWVSGVVAGLSTHLQTGRQNPPRSNNLDDIYIDIGASSAAEVKQAGVEVLDPIAIERKLYPMAYGKLTGAAIGDRFGAAVLLDVLRHTDASKLKGTLTVAFVRQQWATSRGLDRLLQIIHPDEMVYVGRLLPRRAGPGAQAAQRTEAPAAGAPRREPGSGALIVAEGDAPAGLGANIKILANENRITMATASSAALPRVSYTRGPVLPEKFAHLSIATAWASTPGELIDSADLHNLSALVQAYVSGAVDLTRRTQTAGPGVALPPPALPAQPKVAPAATEILKQLVEAYGVSGYETPVSQTVARLLPSWAKPTTDDAGNLILRVSAAKGATKLPSLVFVAHIDELGYVVESIADDGRLIVRTRGGGIIEFFAGHALLVHTAVGMRPGVMELPAGWDQPGFEWPRGGGGAAAGGQAPQLRVDVGARSKAEVEALGIKASDRASGKVGDSMTIPKKYRKLFGTRANGRSFDDRVGSTALVAAAWALGPNMTGRDVTFIWSTREEVGLEGAKAAADAMAKDGRVPDYVFAADTFVSSDSPLESKRFANAAIGKGFVIRAVDNSNITDRKLVDKLIGIARANAIPVQYGVTGGGNDGAAFLRHGTVDVPIAWALRYSHSPGELIDTRDVEALGRIVVAISRSW